MEEEVIVLKAYIRQLEDEGEHQARGISALCKLIDIPYTQSIDTICRRVSELTGRELTDEMFKWWEE